MKELAYVVHDLVSSNGAPDHPCLSQLEQAALSEMEPLLRLPPRDLSKLLAQTKNLPEWLER
jgi:hypothetical protein